MVAAAAYSSNDADAILSPASIKAGSKGPISDYEKRFSQEASARIMPGLRELAVASAGVPGIIPMNAGLPPAELFPMADIQVSFKDGSKLVINDAKDVEQAQQYNLTLRGHPKLLQWVERHVQRLHSPPAGHETIITSGSNLSIDIILKMFLNPGDSCLVEEYTYAHVPESMFDPCEVKTIPIKTDNEGIIPSSLEEALSTLQAKGAPMPKLLYTIPVGQNPTGATSTLERKEQVYALCRRFDIIILEDDPYYYLQYQSGAPPKGLKNLVPSYLSMDKDCRVIRLDSFSKVLVPGLRLGWITAHPRVIEKFIYHFHGVAMGPGSMSQVMMGALLEKMGSNGFEEHLKVVQQKYATRAELIMAAADKHLKGLAEWAPVTSGMFMWLKLTGIKDVNAILPKLKATGVIVVPGTLALHSYPNLQGATSNCIRLSFVTAAEEQLEEGIKRLAAAIRQATAS